MKKLAIFAAAFVLTLGLAQCKKEQPNAQNIEGETVHITLNVNNNGSRADVNTSTGHYDFKDGDKLYVGYNGACAGALDYSASTSKFSGDISLTEAATAQKLHFYYLGGGTATQVVGTQQYTVDISDQTLNYPVISYGTSDGDYTGAGTYTTTLLNQCALVEFTTNEIPTTTAVSISGMKNKVTVDFNGNTLTPSSEGTGSIKLHAESATSRWAILLPDGEVTTTATAEGYAATEITIPAINNNNHWTQINGKNISFTMSEAAATTITLTPSEIDYISGGDSKTIDGITIATRYEVNGGSSFDYNGEGEMYFNAADFTFSSSESVGKISKIEVNYTGDVVGGDHDVNPDSWEVVNSGEKFTLSGNPTYSVVWSWSDGIITGIQSIVFTLSN